MKPLVCIPDKEFHERIQRAQEHICRMGLDALLVHSNEAEMANVRYFSDYWPIFESAGVFIPAQGEPALLIGPESEAYARDRSKIPHLYRMIEYREPAEPDYPGIPVVSFPEVFAKHGCRNPRKLGIGGWAVLPLPVWHALINSFPGCEMVKADRIMADLRGVKSDAEIACLQKAFAIAEQSLGAVINAMRPEVTELELVGIAQSVLYAAGAEYEGMPQYVLSGPHSRHAISRPTSRCILKGELVQLNISARAGGYASGVGRPVCLGPMPAAVSELVEFGLEAHLWTIEHMQPGALASDIAGAYEDWVKSEGYGDYLLYGPCHGLGLIEVEPPWLEKSSDYRLMPGMTFQADTFFHTPPGSRLAAQGLFGLRWEDGLLITQQGNRLFSQSLWGKIEIPI